MEGLWQGLWHCPPWFFWLVVDLPLWKIWKSMGRIIPRNVENTKCLKPPISFDVLYNQAMACAFLHQETARALRLHSAFHTSRATCRQRSPFWGNPLTLIFLRDPWRWVSEYMTWCPYYLYDMYDCISISHSIAMMFGVHSSFKNSMCRTCSMLKFQPNLR